MEFAACLGVCDATMAREAVPMAGSSVLHATMAFSISTVACYRVPCKYDALVQKRVGYLSDVYDTK